MPQIRSQMESGGRQRSARRSSFASAWSRFDRMLEPAEQQLLGLSGAQLGDTVIDVGCGAGTTSLNLARRVGTTGRVLGIDTRMDVLEVARQRAARADLGQLAFVQGDAAIHPFPAGVAQAVVSRFGTLHFAQPRAAYAHLRGALAPGAASHLPAQGPRSEMPGPRCQDTRSCRCSVAPLPIRISPVAHSPWPIPTTSVPCSRPRALRGWSWTALITRSS